LRLFVPRRGLLAYSASSYFYVTNECERWTQPATHALRGKAARTMSASTAAHPKPFLHRTYHASSSAIASPSVIDVPSLASTPPPASRRNAFHARILNELAASSYARIRSTRPLDADASSSTGIPVSTSILRLVINLRVDEHEHVSVSRSRIRFVPPTKLSIHTSREANSSPPGSRTIHRSSSMTHPSALHALSPRACATFLLPSSSSSFRKVRRNSDTTSARSSS
jgi:hypothetical protein